MLTPREARKRYFDALIPKPVSRFIIFKTVEEPDWVNGLDQALQ